MTVTVLNKKSCRFGENKTKCQWLSNFPVGKKRMESKMVKVKIL
jgi:hypothetical protein